MSQETVKTAQPEWLLARLLGYGTWLASGVTGLGLAMSLVGVEGTPNAEATGKIELFREGKLIGSEPVLLVPGRAKRLVFRLDSPEAASLEARLTPDGFDALALDNTAYLQIPKSRPLSVYVPSTLPAFRRALAVQKDVQIDDEIDTITKGPIGLTDEIAFITKADATVIWAHRNGTAAGESDVLAKTLATLKFPSGDYYAWIACESLTAKALRRQLITDHGANPKWMRAAGYWRRGAVAIHDVFEN